MSSDFHLDTDKKEALEERVKTIKLLEIYVSNVAISFILFLRRTAIFHRQERKKKRAGMAGAGLLGKRFQLKARREAKQKRGFLYQ
jgi:hypothetical protein